MESKKRNLYQASKELNQLKWWEFCSPSVPILIKSPKNDEIGYCVFLDGGVNVYLGDTGFLSYLDYIDSLVLDPEEFEGFKVFYRQKMIRVSFEDRQDISDEDYEQIKGSGLSFRGKKQWPVFRRYEPGRIPNTLKNTDDIEFMTVILEQLTSILMGVKKGVWEFSDDQVLMATHSNGSWEVQYRPDSEVFNQNYMNPYAQSYRNDLKVHRLKKLPQKDVTLEGIQFFIPEPFVDEESEQVVFPFITAFVDEETGIVYLNDFEIHDFGTLNQINDKLADLMLNDLQFRPTHIHVQDEKLLGLIKDLCNQIDIECSEGHVSVAEEFMESLLEFGQSGRYESEFDEEEMEFDFEDEMIPEAVVEQVFKMGHELYELIAEMPEIETLPQIQKQATLEVFLYTFIHMGVEYREMLPVWRKKTFESFIQSGNIEKELDPKLRKHIYPSMIKCLECAGKIDLLKDTDELIKIVHHYYK